MKKLKLNNIQLKESDHLQCRCKLFHVCSTNQEAVRMALKIFYFNQLIKIVVQNKKKTVTFSNCPLSATCNDSILIKKFSFM